MSCAEVGGEFGQLVGGVGVHGGVHRLEQLAALLGRHAVEERLHLAHLAGEHLHELVEGAGRVVAEHRAPLVHEAVEVRLEAVELVAHHLVEVAQHLPHRGHLLGVHVLDLLAHLRGDGAEHLLPELVHELLELALRLGVDEVEVLQVAEGARRALGELVEALAVAVGALLEEVAELRGLLRLLAAHPAEVVVDLAEPAVGPGALGADDVLEPLLEVAHDGVGVVAVERLVAAGAEAFEEVVESGEAAVVVLCASADEVAERAAEVAVVDDVLGHGVEERIGVGFERLLGAVPPGEAVEPCHGGIVN